MGLLFDDSYLLSGKSFIINQHITVNNPTLQEILDYGEEKYNKLISLFISKPSDYKTQLFDIGVDFETLNDFEFFCSISRDINPNSSNILFNSLDFSRMRPDVQEDGKKILTDGEIVIDELTYNVMIDFIRKVNGIPIKKPETYANEHVKKYVLEMERDKLKYKKMKPFESCLLPMISALVNCDGGSYDYSSVMKLTVSQLNDAILRIKKISDYNNVLQGIYTGNVKSENINFEEICWFS